MSQVREELLESISGYIYGKRKNFPTKESVDIMSLTSFLSIKNRACYEKDRLIFVDTGFLLARIITAENARAYFKLIRLIQKQLYCFPNTIFDFLPIRFFGEEFHKNNHFYLNFKSQEKLLTYYKSLKSSSLEKSVSIQILISRLDFLEDVFSSISNQKVLADEIFLFVNFKNKTDILLFEKILTKFYQLDDELITLVYAINPVSESEARAFMPSYSRAQYILPLDDDDFLHTDCLFEVKNVLGTNNVFSLIKGLYRKIDIHDCFSSIKSKDDDMVENKVRNELTRREGNYLFPANIASVDQLYVYNKDILGYYDLLIPKNKINNTGIEIELFLRSEEIGGIYLIQKELYFRREWAGQVTSDFSFQKELFRYLYKLIQKVVTYRNIKKFAKIDLFPYVNISGK